MANLDAAALAELRRLLPTPCPVCGGERHFAELSSGFGCCSVPVAAIDDKDGQDAAARHWLASYAPSVPGAIGKLLDALPHLLTLAERQLEDEAHAPTRVRPDWAQPAVLGWDALTLLYCPRCHRHFSIERRPWNKFTAGDPCPCCALTPGPAATIDPALLDRLAERYAPAPIPPCPVCGGERQRAGRDGAFGCFLWRCPKPECDMGEGEGYLDPADDDVLRLVAAVRGLTGGNGERKEQGE